MIVINFVPLALEVLMTEGNCPIVFACLHLLWRSVYIKLSLKRLAPAYSQPSNSLEWRCSCKIFKGIIVLPGYWWLHFCIWYIGCVELWCMYMTQIIEADRQKFWNHNCPKLDHIVDLLTTYQNNFNNYYLRRAIKLYYIWLRGLLNIREGIQPKLLLWNIIIIITVVVPVDA